MSGVFQITERHYSIIVQQVIDNYPQESGGFIGGQDFYIKAIQPVFNRHLFNKTDTYGLQPDDFIRARQFFQKHGLEYFGVYHSHPNGAAYPSHPDINTGQKYHFIIAVDANKSVDFRVYEIQNRQPIPMGLQIVQDGVREVVDIYHPKQTAPSPQKNPSGGSSSSSQSPSTKSPTPSAVSSSASTSVSPPPRTLFDEAADLETMVNGLINDRPSYQKLPPKSEFDSSDFSTLA